MKEGAILQPSERDIVKPHLNRLLFGGYEVNFSLFMLGGVVEYIRIPLDEYVVTGIWSAIKFGFIWFLEKVFLFTDLIGVPSYALAIFLFTIVVKLLLQPLMNKQMRSMRQMQRLQPKITELQKRYQSNPQKLQQEQMKLYKDAQVSPFSGCLPLLIQMPIIIALLQALREFSPLVPEFYTFFWISDLSEPDPTGWVLPVLTAGAMFFQQWLSTTNKTDRTQRMMLYFMPIMFGFFVRSFPSGLALYWIFYSLVGAAIQYVMNRRWSKEDAIVEAREAAEREAELEAKRAKKAKKQQYRLAANNGKQQSMQLEDYDEESFYEDDDYDEEYYLDVDNEENNDSDLVADRKRADTLEFLARKGIEVKTRKERSHPYKDEFKTIEYCVMPDGKEKLLTEIISERASHKADRADA